MPQPIDPTRLSFSPQTQERVQQQLIRRQALFTENLTQNGVSLYQNRPGRVFNLGNNGYYYNTGTAADGSYIPSFTYSNGRLTAVGLRSINEAQIPINARTHSQLAIRQLDLRDNGDGTYSRNGFVGTYTVREDGGIQFSGGHHASNRNITFPPQVYYNGYWYRLGQTGAGTNIPRNTTTRPAGLGSPRNPSEGAGVPRASATTDSFRPLRTPQVGITAQTSSPDTFSQASTTSSLEAHPEDLRDLITSVRNYQEQARAYRDSQSGRRIADPASPSLPNRASLPRGFPILPRGGVTYLSQYPTYAFINRGGNVYYRNVNSSARFWRSMTAGEDNNIYELVGGTGSANDRSYMQRAGSVNQTPTTQTNMLTTSSSPTVTTTISGSRNRIPPRAGDRVGYYPSQGQSPLRVESFSADLTGLIFTARRDGRDRRFEVNFQPQTGTSRDMFVNRRDAHQSMWDAGISVIPQFAEETHQGSRGMHSTYRLTGFTVEFYRPGNYSATTRRNFYTWYSLDGGARAAHSSSYPTDSISINVE